MKHLLFSLLLLAIAAAARAEPTPALVDFFQKLKAGEKQTVVAFGTSLTRDGAWVGLMREWFEKKFPGLVTVVNAGGRGQNSDWGVKQVEAGVLARHPGLVFIEFSYNDAHQRFNLTPEHCLENLEKIVAALRRENPPIAIVLQTMNAPWNPPSGNFVNAETNRPNLETYNENYRHVAREQKLALVDNYPVFLKIKETDLPKYQAIVPDGSHPNKIGSTEVTWANVKALLEAAAQ